MLAILKVFATFNVKSFDTEFMVKLLVPYKTLLYLPIHEWNAIQICNSIYKLTIDVLIKIFNESSSSITMNQSIKRTNKYEIKLKTIKQTNSIIDFFIIVVNQKKIFSLYISQSHLMYFILSILLLHHRKVLSIHRDSFNNL